MTNINKKLNKQKQFRQPNKRNKTHTKAGVWRFPDHCPDFTGNSAGWW
jgi:hypothetical protein